MAWEVVVDNIIDVGSYLVVAAIVLALPIGMIVMFIIWLIN